MNQTIRRQLAIATSIQITDSAANRHVDGEDSDSVREVEQFETRLYRTPVERREAMRHAGINE